MICKLLKDIMSQNKASSVISVTLFGTKILPVKLPLLYSSRELREECTNWANINSTYSCYLPDIKLLQELCEPEMVFMYLSNTQLISFLCACLFILWIHAAFSCRYILWQGVPHLPSVLCGNPPYFVSFYFLFHLMSSISHTGRDNKSSTLLIFLI